MAKLVSKIYADALFQAAREQGRVDRVYEDVLELKSVLKAHDELLKFLGHPRLSREEKQQALEQIFGGHVEDDLMGLLTTAVEKDRQQEIPKILDEFVRMVKEEKKIGTACVTSAVELSDAQKARLLEKLLETTDYREFEMDYRVDSALIGGLVIRIGDRVADSSVRTQLYDLKKQLMAGQLEG